MTDYVEYDRLKVRIGKGSLSREKHLENKETAMERNVDRKVIVALLARELRERLVEFTRWYAEPLRLYIGVEADEFQDYLLDALPEAVEFIKAQKSEG